MDIHLSKPKLVEPTSDGSNKPVSKINPVFQSGQEQFEVSRSRLLLFILMQMKNFSSSVCYNADIGHITMSCNLGLMCPLELHFQLIRISIDRS